MKYVVQIAELEEKDGDVITINSSESACFDTWDKAEGVAKSLVNAITHSNYIQFFCSDFSDEHSVGVTILIYNNYNVIIGAEDYAVIPPEEWNE